MPRSLIADPYWLTVIDDMAMKRNAVNNVISVLSLIVCVPIFISLRWFKKKAIVMGLNAIANRAIGQDWSKIKRIATKPDDLVFNRISIDANIERKLLNENQFYRNNFLADFYEYAGDHPRNLALDRFLGCISDNMTDPNLIHSQYYQNVELIRLIAEHIERATLREDELVCH